MPEQIKVALWLVITILDLILVQHYMIKGRYLRGLAYLVLAVFFSYGVAGYIVK